MDFFEAQERARRTTWKLVFLYAMALLLTIASVYFVCIFLFALTGFGPYHPSLAQSLWQPRLLIVVSSILLILIFSGSMFRIAQLRKGGRVVAQMLGGRRIDPSTRDHKERQLINVVEEMSIASGIAVPEVYVLDREESINAFAAGFTTRDAVVGVTRGTLEKLDRNELQGVIAHEFSHIFNGDMRLNIRLIGILNGILLLHVMGLIMVRSFAYVNIGRSGGRGRGGQWVMLVILLGLALCVIGYIGMIFGRMIQAAISRQREYLADAAAVQYTRNPEGIVGALTKIGFTDDGGKINDGHAMEMSHLFFTSSFHSFFDTLFSSHPPLQKRINAIGSGYVQNVTLKKKRPSPKTDKERVTVPPSHKKGGGIAGPLVPEAVANHPALRPELILAAIGTVEEQQINRAQKILEEIPEALKNAAHEPLAAESLITALLLAGREPAAETIPEWIEEQSGVEMKKQAESLLNLLKKGKREWFLPLTDMTIPTLRQMSEQQYLLFREMMERLIQEDKKISLFEFTLEKLIIRQLDTAFSEKMEPKVKHQNLKRLGEEFSVLLSIMSYFSDGDTRKAWTAGVESIKDLLPPGVALIRAKNCSHDKLNRALDELDVSSLNVKKSVLTALVHAMISDHEINIKEKELLRAVSEAIGCPIPVM